MYDYVIVGAGSAGCVLAGRLSEDPACEVALLEAGGSDRTNGVRIPAAFTSLFKTERDWNFTTTPQSELHDREMYWPRGKMLGGSSSMNAQMWIRGHRDDYDAWAEQGAEGWAWSDLEPLFRRVERRSQGGVFGTDGPLWIEDLRDPNPTTAAFLEGCAEIGLERLPSLNEADNTGFAPMAVTQHRGRRWSAADGYLRPARKRKNLTVLTDVLVDRVLWDGQRAMGVEYVDGDGERQQARADREVILSGGSLGSPVVLARSGVGPVDDLRALGIEPVAESPSVGANLQDHLVLAVIRECPEPVSMITAESPRSLVRYLLFRKGMLSSNVGEAAAFVRTLPSLTAPDIELIFAPVPYQDHGQVEPTGHGTTIGVVLLQPESRGWLRLVSTDPAEPPAIDAGYLTKPADLEALVRGVRAAQRIYESDAMAPYRGDPVEPDAEVVTDEDVADFAREQAETLYHPSGTCRMGSDDDAVVDPELRVRGVDRLRVVDASVMPSLNRGHTHAPTVVIAERAAELITGGSR